MKKKLGYLSNGQFSMVRTAILADWVWTRLTVNCPICGKEALVFKPGCQVEGEEPKRITACADCGHRSRWMTQKQVDESNQRAHN